MVLISQTQRARAGPLCKWRETSRGWDHDPRFFHPNPHHTGPACPASRRALRIKSDASSPSSLYLIWPMHAAEAPAEGQADSMAAATTTTRRSRAKPNSACNFCVKRKIACDAAKPQCAQCVKRGRICTYEPRARGEEEARDAERPAGSLSRQQQVMALYAQARAANTRQHSVDPGRTLIYDRQGGSAETLKSRTPSDGSSDFSGAVATSRIVIGRPLTTPTHEILPDPDTMLGLYSTYRNSIGSSVFFDWLGTVEENSPLLRLSIACVSARAVPNSEDVCRRLFRRTRLALEPTLAGAVEPTVDVCRALMNLIAFLGLSEDFAELLAAQQLLKLLSGFIKSMGIMNEANHVNTRGYGGTVVASHDMAERRMLFWWVPQALGSLCVPSTF